jgi:hypothetical protein
MSLALIVKIGRDNPDCLWGGAPLWRINENQPGLANQTF